MYYDTFIEKKSYLQSFKGQLNRYKYRYNRRITIYFDWKPKSKKAISTKEKIEFQKNILQSLNSFKRQAFRKYVAISIKVNTIEKNPPHIHTLTKNILDMLGKPIDGVCPRNGLLYFDDKQIKYLSIEYTFNNSTNDIVIEATSFNDFLEDLSFVNKIFFNTFNSDLDIREIKKEVNEEVDEFREEEHRDNYLDLKNNSEKRIKNLGEELYKSMLRFSRMSVQDDFINNIRIKLYYIYCFFRANGHFRESNYDYIENIDIKNSQTFSNWLLKIPLYIKLPQLPLNSGESRIFKDKIKSSLEEYKNKYEILNGLYSPIILDVIYKPPKTNVSYNKDLDNIMRLIVPEFNEIFLPPIIYEGLNEGAFSKYYKLPNSIKHSIVGYNIIEIPRIDKDDDGCLIISLSRNNMDTKSIWERMDDIISISERKISD